MFQFTRFADNCLCIQQKLIQESRDQRLFIDYPKLFADFHAFRRLLMPRHPPCTLNSLTTNIQISPVNYLLCEKQTTFRGEPFIWVWPWLHDQQIKPNIIQITISICEVFRLHVRATVGKDSYSPHSSFNMLKSVNFSTTHSRVVFLIVWNWSKLSLTTRLQSPVLSQLGQRQFKEPQLDKRTVNYPNSRWMFVYSFRSPRRNRQHQTSWCHLIYN